MKENIKKKNINIIIKKINKETSVCRLKSKKQLFITILVLIVCSIWIIGHFVFWRHKSGCMVIYYIGIIFEYLVPAIFTSTVFYILINWLPENKKLKRFINNIYVLTDDKPLVGSSYLEGLYNDMSKFLMKFLIIEGKNQHENNNMLYKNKMSFANIHDSLKNTKISYSNDTIADMHSKAKALTITADLNKILFELINQDNFVKTLKEINNLAYKINCQANSLLNESIVENDDRIYYLLRGIRSCKLSVWSHYGKWLEMQLGKFNLVKTNYLDTFDIEKIIAKDFAFLSTELYKMYRYYRILHEYLSFAKTTFLYQDLTEQNTRKQMNK